MAKKYKYFETEIAAMKGQVTEKEFLDGIGKEITKVLAQETEVYAQEEKIEDDLKPTPEPLGF